MQGQASGAAGARTGKISVVTPCFNEAENVEECRAQLRAVFDAALPGYELEHIFCDNASSDGTADMLRRMAASHPYVKVIINARNYGPFRSTFNGLRHATGDAVVVLFAADLQDPPEVIVDFVRKWEEGHEVVYGIRANRQEGTFMRSLRKLYYRLVGSVANIEIPLDAGEFQLIDRAVLVALLRHEDHYPYIRGMIANCGFRSIGISYTWKQRRRGISKNRLYHLVDQGLNGLISFTNLPMRLCMAAGFVIAISSFLFAAFAAIAQLWSLGRIPTPGVATLIVAIFFFGGVQLIVLGVIGEYVSAIHQQVRKRPLVVERETLNCTDEGPRTRSD